MYRFLQWRRHSKVPLVGLSNPSDYKQCTGVGGSTSAGLFMTFGDSCVEHFDEYTVTSSIQVEWMLLNFH